VGAGDKVASIGKDRFFFFATSLTGDLVILLVCFFSLLSGVVDDIIYSINKIIYLNGNYMVYL
jgi:hypothetical protein